MYFLNLGVKGFKSYENGRSKELHLEAYRSLTAVFLFPLFLLLFCLLVVVAHNFPVRTFGERMSPPVPVTNPAARKDVRLERIDKRAVRSPR